MRSTAANAGSSVPYSKVPGSNARQAASNIVGGNAQSNRNKPPATNGRGGPNVRSGLGAASSVNKRQPSRGAAADEDQVMSSAYSYKGPSSGLRSDSAKRRAGASAAAYHAQSLGLDSNALLGKGAMANRGNSQRKAGESVFEITDSLMEQLGTPEMLLQELKMAKRDIETLKNQLEVKDKSVANYRLDASKMRKENYELKRQIIALKEKLASKEKPAGGGNAAAALNMAAAEEEKEDEPPNDLAAARAMALAARVGGGGPRRAGAAAAERQGNNRERDLEANIMAQMQMAIHMNEMENRINERQMMMMALHQGAGVDQAAAEEERLLQRAIEESKNQQPANDPNNPDVDRMTYEQLMEMQENAGHVNRGYSRQQIDSITSKMWIRGRTKEEQCLICMENFTSGKRIKSLKCGHDYDAACIDKWLKEEKRCPVCSKPPFD